MISFDQCLTDLVQRRLCTYAEAAANATNAADFALHFRGVSKGGAAADATFAPPPAAPPAPRPGAPPPGPASETKGDPDFQIERFKE
jgi:hypothetical protein